MSLKRKRTSSPNTQQDNTAADDDDDIYRSNPITDRASTFQAFYSPTLAPRTLQNHVECSTATHKTLAWREPGAQKTLLPARKLYITQHDDDGETNGGKKISAVLEALNVRGACVVARWYGGVMLGPVRFEYMQTVAREAIERFLSVEREREAKRRRGLEEEGRRMRLVKALAERDGSIVVLRALVGEKEEAVKRAIMFGVEALGGDGESKGDEGDDGLAEKAHVKAVIPAPPPMDYSAMPLDRLKALDKARDATLAFLLKRIDKAEADLKAIETPDQPP